MVISRGHQHIFRFVCRCAQRVYLLGDFNNWSTTSTAMEDCGAGLWEVALHLSPGTYRFGYFVIHSRWFGGRASIERLDSDEDRPTSIRFDDHCQSVTIPRHRPAAYAASPGLRQIAT